MTIKDLINSELIYDTPIWDKGFITTDSIKTSYIYGMKGVIVFKLKKYKDYSLAICKDESFSKNKFELHVCDIYTSLKKVEL